MHCMYFYYRAVTFINRRRIHINIALFIILISKLEYTYIFKKGNSLPQRRKLEVNKMRIAFR